MKRTGTRDQKLRDQQDWTPKLRPGQLEQKTRTKLTAAIARMASQLYPFCFVLWAFLLWAGSAFHSQLHFWSSVCHSTRTTRQYACWKNHRYTATFSSRKNGVTSVFSKSAVSRDDPSSNAGPLAWQQRAKAAVFDASWVTNRELWLPGKGGTNNNVLRTKSSALGQSDFTPLGEFSEPYITLHYITNLHVYLPHPSTMYSFSIFVCASQDVFCLQEPRGRSPKNHWLPWIGTEVCFSG